MGSALFLYVNLFLIILSNLQNNNMLEVVNGSSQTKKLFPPYPNRTPTPPGLMPVYEQKKGKLAAAGKLEDSSIEDLFRSTKSS